jgi:hypothetical protein
VRTTILFFALILMSRISALAQTPDPSSFEIDTLTTVVNSVLPFDVPFILKLRGTDAPSIHSGIIYQWKERRNAKFFVHKRKGFKKTDDLKVLFNIDAAYVFPRKQGVDIYVGPIPPNKNLAVMLAHRFDGDLLASLYEINENLRVGNTGTTAALINTLVINARRKIQSNYNFDARELNSRVASFNFATWVTNGNVADPVGGYTQFYNTHLSGHYSALFDPAPANSFVHPVPIAGLTTAALSIVGSIAHAQGKNNPELAILASIVQRNQSDAVQLGLIAMTPTFFKPAVESYRIDLRINNLTASKKSLESLTGFLEALIVSSGQQAVIDPILASVRSLYTAVNANLTFAKPHLDAIVTEVSLEPNLTYTTWAFGDNQILDLKTKGSRYVIPVIGLTLIKAYGNTHDEIFVRPYFGASIYLRAVNKDVPFTALHQQFLHRFSFNLGITTTKISRGEFTDLMGSLSVMAGANYKLTQGIQLSAGTAIMQRKNVNPAINDPKISWLNPYVSIAFDLDLVSTIKSLTDKL